MPRYVVQRIFPQGLAIPNRMRRVLAGAVSIAALGAPASAVAKFNLEPTVSQPATPAQAPDPAPTGAGAGFQWGDAGIGAAGAVLVLGTGALAFGMPRRSRRGARAA